MPRLIAFFVLVLVLYSVLGYVPWIGPIFQRAGCFGVWVTAIALSWFLARYGERALRRGRDRAQMRQLEAVGSAYNHGKIGSLYLNQGRVRRAIEHLSQAVEGEPEVAEWHYRLGCAHLILRRREAAVEALQRAVAIDEEHAYGGAQMRLAEALAGCDRHEEAIAALETYERNHGPVPESAYRRGRSHERLGNKAEASAALDEVGSLARQSARYQRRTAGMWTFRAWLARLF